MSDMCSRQEEVVKDHDRKQGGQACSRRPGPNPCRSESAESYPDSHRTLIVLELLAAILLAVSVLGYIRSRPNTAGIASEGPFDGNRAFADLKRLVAFGPRPSGSEALGASP